jgi:polyisoprenyl-teichoic acid--peptidoglycan teichoic acid transferase
MRALVGVVVGVLVIAGCSGERGDRVVVGKVTTTASTAPPPGPTIALPAPELGRPPPPEPRAARHLKGANGRPYGTIAFRSDVPVPRDLRFVLVAGSDARPREEIQRTRADSIHLIAVNPRTLQGTVLGFPRDAWVEIPGRGAGKINTALQHGGPDLLAKTVTHLTGLPVHYYVLTGFNGLITMVNELGGVDVHVDRRMDDRASGAHFERGWHHFDGAEALAFSRNRHDVPYGDFSRSENQGKIILAALAKMRAEVGDDGGVRRWLQVLTRHVYLDVPAGELPGLAALGRRVDPASLTNLVVPGRVGTAGSQSVVYLGEEAARIFLDLRPDATIGNAGPVAEEETSTTTRPSTTTTSSSTSTTDTTAPSWGF